MENKIKEFLEKHDYAYTEIKNKDSIKKIYDVYFNDIKPKDGTSLELFYFGKYHYIKKKYDSMKKYYLMAINKGNSKAMNNLGLYYKKQKDYDKALETYREYVATVDELYRERELQIRSSMQITTTLNRKLERLHLESSRPVSWWASSPRFVARRCTAPTAASRWTTS